MRTLDTTGLRPCCAVQRDDEILVVPFGHVADTEDYGTVMKTISELFFEQAQRQPHKIALILGTRTITYAGLLVMVEQQRVILRTIGFTRGDHLLTQLKNDIDFIVILLAAADAGLTVVPLNPAMPRAAVENMAIATDSTYLISEGFEENSPRSGLKFTGQPDDLFLLITTSGSTGDPKPIMLKQATKLRRVIALIELYEITEDDITLISTPMYHSMGMRVALASLLTGGTLVLMKGWSVGEWIRLVAQHRVTFAVPVASQIKQIALSTLTIKYNLVSLRCLVFSSAALEANIKQFMRAQIGCPLHECYGTTEVAIVTSGSSDHADYGVAPAASCGLSTLGVGVATNDEGEILVSTYLLFDGYYNLPELTAATMEYGFFKTGDLGRLDHLGNLFYLGRIKELINVGGTKVYPLDVEAVLNQHPDIEECAAFPQVDETLGEAVAIAVVAKEGLLLDLRSLQKFCLPHLTDEQLPRAMHQVLALPKTDSGKLQRVKLQEMFK